MDLNLEAVFEAIRQANGDDIYEIVEKAMDRYRSVYPEREIMYLSVPKEDVTERRSVLAAFIKPLKEQEDI